MTIHFLDFSGLLFTYPTESSTNRSRRGKGRVGPDRATISLGTNGRAREYTNPCDRAQAAGAHDR
jgi:hypothetical protein